MFIAAKVSFQTKFSRLDLISSSVVPIPEIFLAPSIRPELIQFFTIDLALVSKVSKIALLASSYNLASSTSLPLILLFISLPNSLFFLSPVR